MKPLDKRTQKFVNYELHLLRDTLNRQLNASSEKEVIIPTTEPLTTENTLFNIELSLLSIGNKKFISRH